jgi:transcriptional regulator with XRE-family HTH domain
MTEIQPRQQASKDLEETMPEKPTLIEELEKSDEGAQEMAAARLAVEVSASLQRAMSESGISQKRLCELLTVTPGAVSQVVNGDGNLRVGTMGKYFRAMGYQARVFLEPVEPGRYSIASRATCAAITDELREFARMTLNWTSPPAEVATPHSSIWMMPVIPEATAFQPVTLQLKSSSEGRDTEIRTGR